MYSSFKLVPCLGGVCRTLRASNYVNKPVASVRHYWQRRNVFSELSSAIQTVENRMKEMDREMNRVFDDLERGSPLRIPRMLSPFDWGRVKEIPVISKDGSDRTYKLELDMQGMEPEDINISLKDNELTISARREEKRPDGSQFVRENKYQYTLPKEVNPDTLRSLLSEGVLTIEAPLPALESKEIPVKIESSESDSDKETKKQ